LPELHSRVAPQFSQVLRWCKAAAFLHDRLEQRFAGQLIIVRRNDVMIKETVTFLQPEDLLAAGPGGLAF
jgi:hypothetical protein